MCEILIQVSCPLCEGTKVKKNGKKANGNQNFYCHSCRKQFQLFYKYNPRNKRLVRSMSLSGSGIRDIQRVLGLTIVSILFILRNWFKTLEEPVVEGHFKNVQIDEMWTFVKQRKAGKRWFWYAYDSDSGKILAFHIGKRNDSACKALMKKLNHLEIDAYRTDDWKSYKKHIPMEKHIISKAKTTNIERRNRDFRTHIKRLCRETVCFSKKGGVLKAYIFIRNKFGSLVKTEHTF